MFMEQQKRGSGLLTTRNLQHTKLRGFWNKLFSRFDRLYWETDPK
jgi:hypothetical protein